MKAEQAERIAEGNKDFSFNEVLERIKVSASKGGMHIYISSFDLEMCGINKLTDLGYEIKPPSEGDLSSTHTIWWGQYEYQKNNTNDQK